MKHRDVGEMGESIFKVWTAQVGITANKVQQDKTGWDFLIEFPLVHETVPTITLPLDKAVPPMTCLMQIKSTDNHTRSWSVKLSNWLRLAKSPFPAFFFVMEFDAQPYPQRAFLVHVDAEYIGRVLQRLRGIPPGEEPDLHKRTMQLTYDDRHAVEPLNGEGLQRAILQHAGENPLTYAEKKLYLLQHVGYEEVKAQVHFDLMVPKEQISDVHEYLVDFALGLIPSLQIRNFTSRDARFGIPAHEPSQRIEETGELRIDRVPVGEYDLQLRTQDGQVEYRVKTRVYLPQGFSHLLDKKYLKVRCAAPCLDFIFWAQQPRFDVRFRLPPFEESHKLSHLFPAARFVLFHQQALTHGGEVLLDLSTKGHHVAKSTFPISSPVDTYTLQVAETIHHAWKVCQLFDLQDDIETRITELMRQRERLCVLALALGPLPDLRITSWINPAIAETTRIVCFPYVTTVVIGQYQCVFALALLGEPIPTGRTNEQRTEYEVRIHRTRLYRHHLYRRDETVAFSGQELIQSIVGDCEQQHIFCILAE